MRKIFSTVLVATALLFSMQANAEITDYESLMAAISAVPYDGTETEITVDASFEFTKPIEVLPANYKEDGDFQNIVLNLGGNTLTYTSSTVKYAIRLYKGVLKVKNGTVVVSNKGAESAFLVCGSRFRDCNPRTASTFFSHLIIDSDATISSQKNGICLDAFSTHLNVPTTLPTGKSMDYRTDVYGAPFYGIAHGVRVDFYGSISAQKYGIKSNGYLRYPDPLKTNFGPSYPAQSGWSVQETDTAYAPYIFLHSNSSVSTSSTADEATAIYSAGYARWCIEGSCSGNTGVYVKSGTLVLNDAEIKSTGESYVTPETGKSSGIATGGCAIVVEASNNYASQIDVTIKGNTEVTSIAGYAIEGVVADNGATAEDVKHLSIENGTITGGTEGSINTTTEIKQVISLNGDIKGGTYSDNTIQQYLPQVGGIITPIYNEETSETVYIVGNKPQEAGAWITDLLSDDVVSTSYVKLTSTAATTINVEKDITCKYLTSTGKDAIVVKNGYTLRVGGIVLGDESSITIEVGGKLIVDSVNGIVAFSASNLILKADASGCGTFALSPKVQANTNPWATVEYYAKEAKCLDSNGQHAWNMFVSPFESITKVQANASTKPQYSGKSNSNWYEYWDGTDWQAYTSKEDLYANAKAFQAIAITNNTQNGDVKYVFEGKLHGNISGQFSLSSGWNFIGNGYTANVNAVALISALQYASSSVQPAIYLWDASKSQYSAGYDVDTYEDIPNEGLIPAANLFVIYSTSDDVVNLNYEALVWSQFEN